LRKGFSIEDAAVATGDASAPTAEAVATTISDKDKNNNKLINNRCIISSIYLVIYSPSAQKNCDSDIFDTTIETH
jgi:hypothetical protein